MRAYIAKQEEVDKKLDEIESFINRLQSDKKADYELLSKGLTVISIDISRLRKILTDDFVEERF